MTDLVSGQRVILVGSVAAGWSAVVPILRQLGATDVLVVATEGVGAGTPPEDAEIVSWQPPDDVVGMMARLRASLVAMADLPADLVDAIDRFDPDHDAVMFAVFLNETPEIAGRRPVAYRRPEWLALEDKTVVDALLDRARVPRAPSRVVAIADALTAAAELDEGSGTVWAADASEGFHGGASLTRWVVTDDEAAAASALSGAHGSTVRVMPFLNGIPCSVHGIVLPDGVVALRPVEMVTLRRGHELVYAGCATYWDPPPDTREEMRSVARRVGEQLRSEVDFRGAFTVDGVATAEGFRPTEVNPRFGAGFNVVARSLATIPLTLVLDLVVAGHRLDVTAAELEQAILAEADARRGGGSWRVTTVPDPVDEHDVVWTDGQWRAADPDEPADGRVVASDRFARILLDADRTPVGPSIAPRAAAFWNWFETDQGLPGAGGITPAPDVLA